MEFSEKLQTLRKNKGMTQDELASLIYVSRTAVSKWESGRGYPSIESLRAISKTFGVTVDELISADEVLSLAEEDGRRRERRISDLVLGVSDIAGVLLLFLPLFANRSPEGITAVSALMSSVSGYLLVIYSVVILLGAALGALMLALSGCCGFTARIGARASVVLGVIEVTLFTLSLQPYAAVFVFMLLVIKSLILFRGKI